MCSTPPPTVHAACWPWARRCHFTNAPCPTDSRTCGCSAPLASRWNCCCGWNRTRRCNCRLCCIPKPACMPMPIPNKPAWAFFMVWCWRCCCTTCPCWLACVTAPTWPPWLTWQRWACSRWGSWGTAPSGCGQTHPCGKPTDWRCWWPGCWHRHWCLSAVFWTCDNTCPGSTKSCGHWRACKLHSAWLAWLVGRNPPSRYWPQRRCWQGPW